MARHHHDEQGAVAGEGDCVVRRADSPFQRHWLYYLVLKYAMIAVAVFVSLYTVYRLYSG
jgi:hypothetical protein